MNKNNAEKTIVQTLWNWTRGFVLNTLKAAWEGAISAIWRTLWMAATALFGISYAISDKNVPVWNIPANIVTGFTSLVDGMAVLVTVAHRCLESPTCLQ